MPALTGDAHRPSCPAPEALAAYVDGRLTPDQRSALSAHLAECERCYELVTEVMRATEEVPALRTDAGRWRPLPRGFLAAAAALILIVGSIVAWMAIRPADSADRPELRQLAMALDRETARITNGRFAAPFDYKPSPSLTRSGALTPPSPDVKIATAYLEKAAASGRPADLAALGIAHVASGNLDEAIGFLERAVAQEPQNAVYLNDAAVAYLARATWRDQAGDWPRALALAERSIRINPERSEAYFNRALALEGLHLLDEAEAAWMECRDREQDGRWVAEADARLEALRGRRKTGSQRNPDLQRLRERIEDEVLPAWGAAWLRDDSQRAAELLAVAAASAEELETRRGDVMPRSGIETIDRSLRIRDLAAVRSLAAGHAAYGQARSYLLNERVIDAAEAMSAASASFAAADSPYALWGPVFKAIALRVQGRAEEALQVLRTIPVETLSSGYHHLRGRHLWTEAVALEVLGRMDGARARLKRAQAEFLHCSEMENLTATEAHAAEVEWFLGQRAAAWTLQVGAMARLDGVPLSTRRNVVLTYGAFFTLSDALPEAALYFQNSLIRSLDDHGSQLGRAHAYAQRARILAQLGDHSSALRDLERSEQFAGALEDPALRERHVADANVLRAELVAVGDPQRAAVSIDSALTYFQRADRTETVARLLGLRAEIHHRLDQQEEARGDLLAAIGAFERDRAALASPDDRMRAYEQQRSLFKRALQLELDAGSGTAALRVAEAGRGARHPSTAQRRDASEDPLRAVNLLADDVTVAYFNTFDESVVIWLLTNRTQSQIVVPITHSALVRSVQEIRRRIDEGASVRDLAPFDPVLAQLLQPVLDAAGSDGTVVFVPDGPLYELPFAALPDDTRNPLVLRHRIVVAHSLSAFITASGRLNGLAPDSAAAFGDGHDTTLSGLPRLTLANDEALAIGRVYGRGEVFTGRDATRTRFLATRQPIVHFAGHATVNRAYPLFSRLWLAPDVGPDTDTGIVAGLDLLERRMDETRVLVLAACDGGAGRDMAGEGMVSLARLFESTGVSSVIASLWPLDERAQSLLLDFHRELRRGRDPAAALAAAQRHFLSEHGTTAPVRLWGGFTAYGGINPSARLSTGG